MMHTRVRAALHDIFALILCTLPLAGCGRESAPTPTPQEPPRVELETVVPLTPGRRTHVAVDSRGNIYWSQETDAGQDVVMETGAGNVPQPLELTSLSLMQELNAPGGSGNIQSIATDRADRLCFYLAGGKERLAPAVLGFYDTRTARLTLLANTAQLDAASGMGDSLQVARGTLLAGGGGEMWLWLRHTDADVLLHFNTADAAKATASSGIKFDRPMGAIRGPAGEIPLRSEQEDLSTPGQGRFFYIDRKAEVLWQIAPDSTATPIQALDGAAAVLTAPVADARGRLYFLAGDGRLLDARADAPAVAAAFGIARPSLLILDAGELTALGRDDFQMPDNVPLETFAPKQMVPEGASESWITYDRASGELLRIRIKRAGKNR
jgi:hypothetical protein